MAPIYDRFIHVSFGTLKGVQILSLQYPDVVPPLLLLQVPAIIIELPLIATLTALQFFAPFGFDNGVHSPFFQ